MSSDAEILAPRDRPGEAGPRPKDPSRWTALVVMRLLAFLPMLALPARRGHSAGSASV